MTPLKADASSQTFSSGAAKTEEKMTQCPDDFSYYAKDHTYAKTMIPIIHPWSSQVSGIRTTHDHHTLMDFSQDSPHILVLDPKQNSSLSPLEEPASAEQSTSTQSATEVPLITPLESTSYQLSEISSTETVPLPVELETSLPSLMISLQPASSPPKELLSASNPDPSSGDGMSDADSPPQSSSSSPPQSSSSSSTTPSDGASSDSSYKPSEESSDSDSEDEPEIDFCKEKKFIIFEGQLNRLLYGQKCPSCHIGHASELTRSMVGTMLRVKITCVCGHDWRWDSQTCIGRQPVGNILTAAAVLLSGRTYETTRFFMSLLNLQFMAEPTYREIHNGMLLPVINHYFRDEIKDVRDGLQGKKVTICGDGRCDSPGYNAKYCTYTCIDMDTNKIAAMELVQVTEASSSVAMEKIGFSRALGSLIEEVDVKVVATDRHTGIRKLMREEHSTIDHQFDVWHFTKSVGKKLTAKAKRKNCQDLMPWVKSITNHIWWSAQNCRGNPDILVEMFQSVTHHICNIHQWTSADLFHACTHQPLTQEQQITTKWLTPDSEAHRALQEILFDKRLVKDIKQLTQACRTGAIEVYHNVYLKYCPKRLHFRYPAMLARAQLAVLDHNSNTGKKHAVVTRPRKGSAKKGEKKYKIVFSKATKTWIAKQVSEEGNYTYLWELMVTALQMKSGDLVVEPVQIPELPPNIVKDPRPSRDEVVARTTTRIARK